MSTTTTAAYSTREVCDAAGVSYRQLDYWCRLGLVRPSLADATGSGSRRRWSTHDAAIVRVLGRVAGPVPVNRLGELVGFLDDLPLQQWAATQIVIDQDGGVWRPGVDVPKVAVYVDLSLIFDPLEPAALEGVA